ncbi:TPA: type II toxin-antitoxin system HicB family antitoxin [Salmonella enterica subsp. enterica serovar Denver]|nr:antitoxin HicB [Salmonella enterica subsp. enterica serovar Denver]ECD5429485.1 antitoxin HicB [Salmonella enterica subsp. enterica serovar Denver]ECE7751926.1 antitoxin HicB [Salmonella enterica subsp. enterica serovar Ngili]HCM3794373.1 type II toxin-antitoxin system HicB family antitoxin [Salmonella enterica subsp. enterica serovar Denver]
MLFSVGIETPKDENTTYGMIVPAFSTLDCGCCIAADTQDQIVPMVKEAILLTVECLSENAGFSVDDIRDAGFMVYSTRSDQLS